jgi:hypothetical protein
MRERVDASRQRTADQVGSFACRRRYSCSETPGPRSTGARAAVAALFGRGRPSISKQRERRAAAELQSFGQGCHWGGKAIAPPRHGLDHALLVVTEGIADLSDAVRKDVVSHDNVRPHRLDQIFPGHAVGILHEKAQSFEALGPQLDFATCGSQGASHNVERKAFKLELPRCRAPILLTALPRTSARLQNLSVK